MRPISGDFSPNNKPLLEKKPPPSFERFIFSPTFKGFHRFLKTSKRFCSNFRPLAVFEMYLFPIKGLKFNRLKKCEIRVDKKM